MPEGPSGGTVKTGGAMSLEPHASRRRTSHWDSGPLHSSPSQSGLLGLVPDVVSSPQLHPTSPLNLKENGIFKLLSWAEPSAPLVMKSKEEVTESLSFSHKGPFPLPVGPRIRACQFA